MYIESSAAKSNWIRIAISLFFLSAPLRAEGPVIEFFVKSENEDGAEEEQHPVLDFFIKDERKPPPKPKTPIRDFFFKKSEDQQDDDLDDAEDDFCEESDFSCDECESPCCGSCDCCN